MNDFFLTVLKMSLTASYVIFIVILVRLLLKKAPKFISYALWGVVGFRLIIPFSFESMFSLMPRNTKSMISNVANYGSEISNSIELSNTSFTGTTVDSTATALYTFIELGTYIWLFGIVLIVLYSFRSTFKLKRHLKDAQLIEKNIFEVQYLKTPFVFGVIKPKIYLPKSLSEVERKYILLHEQTHIKRKDYIVKIIAFFILTIHWFNPLVWIAFRLMSNDMELSCDEKVLKGMGEDIKKPYATSLLNLAMHTHTVNGSPLAFSEGNVKGRIKNVLKYKKPTIGIIVIALGVAIVVGVGLFTNPMSAKKESSLTSELLKYRTEYVGDNSKVGSIINLLVFPENESPESFALSTDNEPYGITVTFKTEKDLYSREQFKQLFQDNAIIMFALIGNVDFINFNIEGDSPYSLKYTREWANQQYDKDVREFAKSEEKFQKLIEARINHFNSPKK